MSDTEDLVSKNYHALGESDLAKLKVKLEIESLQRGLKPQKNTFLQRLNNYFQKNVGQISAMILLFGSLIAPIWNYISNQRQQQLLNLNSIVYETILDPSAELNEANLMKIGTQDPKVVAPVLFYQFNNNSISSEKMSRIFERMYLVNTNLVKKTWSDYLLFLFVPDNDDILEEELCHNALKQFETPLNDSNVVNMRTYVDLIFDLKLDEQKDFKKALDVLLKKCPDSDAYKAMCKHVNRKKAKDEMP